jgi:uncharacterized protein with PQ loop repeat
VLHHHLIDRLAIINGFVSGIALYPQVWIVFTQGSTDGLSLTTFLLVLTNSAIWIVYAMHRGLVSLGIASLLNFFASAALIVAVLFL